jgi:CHAT domain-containing protein
MEPIRELLGSTRDIYLAPDAALNLVPFAALLDEREHYLLENYAFTYLTSGRDLTHLQKLAEPREGAVVLSAPDFGSEKRRLHFPPLPGTAKEAADISHIVAGARLLSGRAARESTVKQLHGPELLHVATHGFYLPSSDNGVLGQPMLRSGLALAGANDAPTADEDGLLTALEVADLDLRGTRLVVLSACETAIGEARAGDGVHGLRRALALAGAQTQLMSLWKVDDAATTDLMVSYYRALQRGRGRSAALRDVQLAMHSKRKTSHPYYWASFIVSGDPRPMPMPAPAKPHASVRPPATRGCACRNAGHRACPDGWWLLFAAGCVLATVRIGRRGAIIVRCRKSSGREE